MSERRDTACCFTGHRQIPEERLSALHDKLMLEISWLVSHGITEFYAGGALGFDTIAALAILQARAANPDLKLYLALPCPEQTKYWNERDIEIYNYILARADRTDYISDHYHAGAMHKRNRFMIDNSTYCVCYWDHDVTGSKSGSSGTLYTVNYARRLRRTLINLCDEPPDDGQLEYNYPL